jgi:hypothetical protein
VTSSEWTLIKSFEKRVSIYRHTEKEIMKRHSQKIAIHSQGEINLVNTLISVFQDVGK